MELKNISEIQALSLNEYETYLDELVNNVPESYPWDTISISQILDTVRLIPLDVITHPLVAEYIKSCKLESPNDMGISCLADKYIFNDELRIIKLSGGNEERYTVLTPLELNNIIATASVVRNTGLIPDDFRTRVEIEIDIRNDERGTEIVEYLKYILLLTEEDASFIIPLPSETLDVDETTARFSSALWFEKIQDQTVILAGLGGIGSYVAFLLSRMHPKVLYLYDDDTVEAVNLAGQMFGINDVGRRKVDAVGRMLREMSQYMSSFCIGDRYTSDTQTADVMICGFDNMDARKTFFDNWVKHVEAKPEEERKNCLFIDGRLAAEEFQVLGIRGDDTLNIIKYAKEYLFSDAEADETLCSYKQTSYMANMIASVMINLFTNFVANSIEDNIRELPFLTTYDGSTMTFKTEW